LDALQIVLAIAIILSLLLAGGGGWLLARRSLSPLAAMASATERITANNLDERLEVGAKDELGRLASRFNELLSRLSASFSQQRQFMADASHELRTPLSVVRTAAQVTLQKPERSDSEYRDALALIAPT
jgi:signal transduction histidine kinase